MHQGYFKMIIDGKKIAAELREELKKKITKLKSNYNIKTNIIKEHIGAISCGIIDSQENIDLDFDEDSNADVDANFVVGERGNIIEIQCTAEKSTFSQQQFLNMMELAVVGINKIIVLQKKTLDEAE